MIEPKTWLDTEIVELMVKEANQYREYQRKNNNPIDTKEMMECILAVMKANYLIEHTP